MATSPQVCCSFCSQPAPSSLPGDGDKSPMPARPSVRRLLASTVAVPWDMLVYSSLS